MEAMTRFKGSGDGPQGTGAHAGGNQQAKYGALREGLPARDQELFDSLSDAERARLAGLTPDELAAELARLAAKDEEAARQRAPAISRWSSGSYRAVATPTTQTNGATLLPTRPRAWATGTSCGTSPTMALT